MKIGILGVGSIGQRHLTNAITSGHEVLFFDPNENMYFQVPNGVTLRNIRYQHREDVLKESDAIIIASPTSCHLDDFASCIQYQKPVLIEKPIGDNLQYATALVSDAERIGLPVMVGYNLRFHPVVKKARTYLDSGELGKPLWAGFCCAQFNNKPPYLRDGVILNWSHEIDLALHLLGPAKLINSFVRLDDGRDDMANINLLHDSECHTNIHLDYVTVPEFRSFTIAFEGGLIATDLPNRHLILIRPDKSKELENFSGDYDRDYADEFDEFSIAIEDHKLPFGCSAREALEVLKICTGVRQQVGLK